MKTLKQLVYMDILKTKCLAKMMIFYLAALVVSAVSTRFAVLGMAIGLYTIIYSVISYDEQSNGTILLGALPVTRRQIVAGKYVFAVLLFFVMDLVVIAINRVLAPFLPESVNLLPFGMMHLSLVMVAVVFVGFMMPLIMCLGPTRARYWAMGTYMVVFFLVFNTIGMKEIPVTIINYADFSLIAYIGCIVLLLLSYFIATYFYEKKQFTA